MSAEQPVAVAPVPRIALDRDEAAAALGMSLRTFERYVQPHVPMLRLGTKRLVPVAELERWAHEAAERHPGMNGSAPYAPPERVAGRRANAPGRGPTGGNPVST